MQSCCACRSLPCCVIRRLEPLPGLGSLLIRLSCPLMLDLAHKVDTQQTIHAFTSLSQVARAKHKRLLLLAWHTGLTSGHTIQANKSCSGGVKASTDTTACSACSAYIMLSLEVRCILSTPCSLNCARVHKICGRCQSNNSAPIPFHIYLHEQP